MGVGVEGGHDLTQILKYPLGNYVENKLYIDAKVKARDQIGDCHGNTEKR
jgi:hypothetical protein